MIPKYEMSFPLVCRACQDESIHIYLSNLTHWNLIHIHTLLFIWIFFIFLANNSETNSKLKKNSISL